VWRHFEVGRWMKSRVPSTPATATGERALSQAHTLIAPRFADFPASFARTEVASSRVVSIIYCAAACSRIIKTFVELTVNGLAHYAQRKQVIPLIRVGAVILFRSFPDNQKRSKFTGFCNKQVFLMKL